MPASCAIRGSFFDFVDDPWKHPGHEDRAARFVGDGLLVVRDGIIEDFGPFTDLSQRHADLAVTHLEGRLILPGFIDGHIHFPQLRVLGAFGNQLLEWLQTWIFPEELKYKDRTYARTAAGHFFDALLAGGTTTAMAFTTSSPVSTEEFFEEATRRGMRVIAGLSGIDRFAPDDFLITPDDFHRETKRLIQRYHRSGRNLYAITPRFPGVCSSEMMESSRRLREEHPDCWVNTHVSENPSEVRMVHSQFPDCQDYTAVHAAYGLLVPDMAFGCPGTSSAASPQRGRPSPSVRCPIYFWATACSASAGPWTPSTQCVLRWAPTWAAATP
jgi:guanine deaminase